LSSAAASTHEGVVALAVSGGSEPRRVLLVARGYPPHGRWGSEFYTRELARGLARRGLDVEVLCPTPHERTFAFTDADGVVVRFLPRDVVRHRSLEASYEDAEFEREFERELLRFDPDVVHFTHLLWSLSVRLPEIARAHGRPTVLTLTDFGLVCHRGQLIDHADAPCRTTSAADCARCIREPGRWEIGPVAKRLKRSLAHGLAALGGLGLVVTARDLERRAVAIERALAALDLAITPTAALRRELVARGLPALKTLELVYALDEAPYRAARPIPTSPVTRIGFLSQFAPHKGVGVLLEAARRLRRRGLTTGYTIDLYGLGEVGRHRRYARRMLAEDQGSTVRVRTPFGADEAPAVLAELAAVVLPSAWCENAPLAALQARAAGVPVVASDAPGLAEILRDGRDGWLFPMGDAEALTERLTAVIARGPSRVRAGAPLSYGDHLDRLLESYSELGARVGAGVS